MRGKEDVSNGWGCYMGGGREGIKLRKPTERNEGKGGKNEVSSCQNQVIQALGSGKSGKGEGKKGKQKKEI